jgi:phytoene synthase
MMCHVMGVAKEESIRPAAHLGVAMQLTNICRDVHEDWQRGRLYIPEAVLAASGIRGLRQHLGTPLASQHAHGLSVAAASLLNTADRYYESADTGLADLSPRCAFAVRSARRIYSGIGDVLRQRGCDPLSDRAFVPLPAKLFLVSRSAWLSVREIPKRIGQHQEWRAPVRIASFPEDVLPV